LVVQTSASTLPTRDAFVLCCKHTNTHTHIHTYTHTLTRIYTHTHTNTHTRTHAYALAGVLGRQHTQASSPGSAHTLGGSRSSSPNNRHTNSTSSDGRPLAMAVSSVALGLQMLHPTPPCYLSHSCRNASSNSANSSSSSVSSSSDNISVHGTALASWLSTWLLQHTAWLQQ